MSGEGKPPAASRSRSSALPRLYEIGASLIRARHERKASSQIVLGFNEKHLLRSFWDLREPQAIRAEVGWLSHPRAQSNAKKAATHTAEPDGQTSCRTYVPLLPKRCLVCF